MAAVNGPKTASRSFGGAWNIWLFALLVFVAFHLGLTLAPVILCLALVGGGSLGMLLAPSATVVFLWLFFYVAILPEIILAHFGVHGIYGVLAAALYWSWSCATGRWDPDMRVAECSSLRKAAFWRHLAAYFPASVHMDGEIPQDGLYLFAVHPHGLWGAHVWSNLIPEAPGARLPRLRRTCTLDMNFKIAGLRDVLFAMGLIGSSSKSIAKCLKKGFSVFLVVGGGKEAMLARPGRMDLVLKNRRGFVRLALEHGASLVPVLGFGETSLYDVAEGSAFWDPLNRVLLRRLGMSLPILQGWRGTFMPIPGPIHTIVGCPLQVPRCPEPSPEKVEQVHTEYCAALQALYEKYKDRFDPKRESDMNIA